MDPNSFIEPSCVAHPKAYEFAVSPSESASDSTLSSPIAAQANGEYHHASKAYHPALPSCTLIRNWMSYVRTMPGADFDGESTATSFHFFDREETNESPHWLLNRLMERYEACSELLSLDCNEVESETTSPGPQSMYSTSPKPIKRTKPSLPSRPRSKESNTSHSASTSQSANPVPHIQPNSNNQYPQNDNPSTQPSTSTELQCWDHGCNGRFFSNRSNLIRHERERAISSLQHSCQRCGTAFRRKSAARRHYEADQCQRRWKFTRGRMRWDQTDDHDGA